MNVSPERSNISRTETSSNTMTGTTKYVRMLHATLKSRDAISERGLSWLSSTFRTTPTTAEMTAHANSGRLLRHAADSPSPSVGSRPWNTSRALYINAAEKNAAMNEVPR